MAKQIEISQPKQDSAINKSKFFSIANLWPSSKIDIMGWLSNFNEDEKIFAHKLLENFLYFNDAICEELMRDAVSGLSRHIINFDIQTDGNKLWEDFIDNAIVVPVMGEDPSLADSGLTYARLARNILGFEEHQLKTSKDAIIDMYWGHVKSRNTKLNVIFVDDFIGTGNQFIQAWKRYEVFQSTPPVRSFEELSHSVEGIHFFYCPLIATEYGLCKIREACPSVIVNPSHIITKEYNALSSSTTIWGDLGYVAGIKFLKKISDRAGFPDTKGKSINDWRGYQKLGLCLALRDSIPDASLAIFRWKNNWNPLFR